LITCQPYEDRFEIELAWFAMDEKDGGFGGPLIEMFIRGLSRLIGDKKAGRNCMTKGNDNGSEAEDNRI